MDRRELLGLLGVGAAGLTALSGTEAAAQAPRPHSDAVHKECLEACSSCAKACEMTYHHCLVMVSEGKKDHAKPLQYAADCASFCALSACNIAKQSPLMVYSCEACADACKDAHAVIAKFDSPEMKAAADSLARCEKSCRSMVEAMGHHHH